MIKVKDMRMTEYLRKYLLVPLIAVVLVTVSLALLNHPAADVAAQGGEAKSLARDLEPATVHGSQVAELNGAPVDDLFLYTFSGEALSGQIPVQVDEVTAGGDYAASEDGLLDANDEIVLMAADLGDRPADPTVLIGTLPISATWYEVKVSDPLSPGQKGWAYLVRSSTLAPGFTDDYVSVIPGGGGFMIDADGYELHLSSTLPAIDYLAMNGSGVDILDRSKLRVVIDIFGGVNLDETDLAGPDTSLIKDGPVRGILRQTAQASAGVPGADADLDSTHLAYAALLRSTTQVSLTLPSLVDLSYVRMSVDLNSAASGATFYNANTPGGVTVDGSPDPVAGTPLSHWAQVSHTTGRLIHVADPTPAGGTQTNYYCDEGGPGTEECDATPETGDGLSYGDAGIAIGGSINESFTAENSFFVLPDAGGNVGATYNNYHFNPLEVETMLYAEEEVVFLPVVFKVWQ